MTKPARPQLNRRHVFAGAGTVGALATVAAVLPRTPAALDPVAAAPSQAAGEDGRYQVTQHVLRYYQTAKV